MLTFLAGLLLGGFLGICGLAIFIGGKGRDRIEEEFIKKSEGLEEMEDAK